MVVQSNNLNLIPGQISPRVNVSQYDKKSRTLTFSLYNGSQPFNISNGMAVTIEGTKPDNTGFQYAMIATAGSNVVSISIEQQMTVIAGDVPCEIVVSNAGKRLASANFILVVEPAALNENTIISETELPLIEEAAELAENIAIYVTTIHEDALKAEGYAVGKQNGVDVTSGSPYFHNNAKWHAEQASSSASTASTKASEASTSATNAASSASTATTKASQATSAASTATSKASEATTAAQTATTKASEASASAQTAQEAAESLIGEVVDSEPYVLRQDLGNLADMALVGGSVAWNQLVSWNGHPTATYDGITYTNNADGSYTVNGTATGTSTFYTGIMTLIANHKYYFCGTPLTESDNTYRQDIRIVSSGSPIASSLDYGTGKIIAPSSSEAVQVRTAIRVNNGTVINNKKFYPQLFDLTQMFGSTIADYIYSLEQATAGAGVAWFRKYFSNVYYGYQIGKIESVNVASRKVVGKNLLRNNAVSQTSRGITFDVQADGTVIANGTATDDWAGITLAQYHPIKKGRYILSGVVTASSANRIAISIAGQSEVTTYEGETSFNVENDTFFTCNCYIRNSGFVANNYEFKPMIRLATVEDATYEPYQEWSADFDSSKQLRGIFYLDANNKLCANGDIYKADGSITRKYGIVDMGTLNWSYDSQNTRFYVAISGKNNGKTNFICGKYVALNVEVSDLPDKSITGQNSSNNMYLKDSSYTDSATFKTAMSGVYLVYELATPTTESAIPFQNPQRAFTDGTEEFVDYGVQSATRDVSIPVGNNTTYQLNETLPPTEDYVDGALKFKAAISALGTDESGRTTASRAYTTGEFFYKDGRMYKVLTSIAQGATFTINTNCQQTTLFAELKALAQ